MATRPPVLFDELAAAFADYGTTVRGYVRYHVVHKNLVPYTSKRKSLSVMDVGGGSGADTAWLATDGHRVTFIEPSTEQRRFAERRFNFLLTDEIRVRITLAGDTIEDIPKTEQFDLVLVHTVAQYQSDPEGFLRATLPYVKPGGIVSVLERGYYGAEARLIRNNRYRELPRLRRHSQLIGNLGQKIHAFKPEEIESVLHDEGFEILDWTGVRVLTDDFAMPVDGLPSAQLKLLLDAELVQGRRPDIRGQGQMLHFIARKLG